MITVIIPAYNRPDCLQRALASLGLQTDQRFNAVVVDDCSTEDIESVVKLYQQNGMTVNYIRKKENGGAGSARNEGLNFVTKFINEKANIVFLDSDDILMPNAVATYNSVIATRKDYHVIASLFLEEHYDAADNMYYTQPPISNVTWIHGKVYSLEFLNKYRLRFPDMPYGEDMAFNAMVYTLSKNQYNANVPTHIRTMEKRSLTNQSNGHAKSTLGYIKGATWFSENVKNRGLLTQAKYSILPNMSAKLYYYYDFVTAHHPEFDVREDCINYFNNIGFAELMHEDNFVVRFIEEFPNGMPKFIEKFAYTPQKSFDEVMSDFGIDVGNYKTIVKTE